MQQSPRPPLSNLPRLEKNPLQEALDNYQLLERELRTIKDQNAQLRADNAGLVAENGVLREHLGAAENDRVRLQAVASTLLGRLLAINDTIAGAVRASIKEGIEAVHATSDGMAAGLAGEATQRVSTQAATLEPVVQMASPEPPQRPSVARLAPIEYRGLSR